MFLQVSLLKLNTAISLNVERAAKIERDNAQARASISRLDAGRRVEDAAGQLGMVMPAAGAICFLDARRAGRCSGGNAAEAGRGVDPVAELAAADVTAAESARRPPRRPDAGADYGHDSPAPAPDDDGAGCQTHARPRTVTPHAGHRNRSRAAQTAPATGAPCPQGTPQGPRSSRPRPCRPAASAATGTGG